MAHMLLQFVAVKPYNFICIASIQVLELQSIWNMKFWLKLIMVILF